MSTLKSHSLLSDKRRGWEDGKVPSDPGDKVGPRSYRKVVHQGTYVEQQKLWSTIHCRFGLCQRGLQRWYPLQMTARDLTGATFKRAELSEGRSGHPVSVDWYHYWELISEGLCEISETVDHCSLLQHQYFWTRKIVASKADQETDICGRTWERILQNCRVSSVGWPWLLSRFTSKLPTCPGTTRGGGVTWTKCGSLFSGNSVVTDGLTFSTFPQAYKEHSFSPTHPRPPKSVHLKMRVFLYTHH